MRMGYSLLKSNNFVPEEVELLREIGLLKEKLKTCADTSEKKDLTKKLNDKALAFNILMERNKRRK